MTNTSGYIRIPRSLLDDELWESLNLKYQHLFVVIVKLASYKPRKFDDYGTLLDVEVGQVCISENELLEHCNKEMTKSDVHRGIKRLTMLQLLHQKVHQRRNILTITHKDTYDLIKNASAPNLHQTCTNHKEEGREVEEEDTKNLSMSKNPKKSQKREGVFFDHQANQFINLDPELMALLEETFPRVDVPQQLREMRIWLMSPKGVSRVGNKAFIINWLKNAPQTKIVHLEPETEMDPDLKKHVNQREEASCATR